MLEQHMYRNCGRDLAEAYDILDEGCQYPPSLEGFLHLLRDARQSSPVEITPQTMARRIVADCRVRRTA